MSYKFIYEHEPSKSKDESGVYRNKSCKEKGELLEIKDSNIKTVYDLVFEAKKQHKNIFSILSTIINNYYCVRQENKVYINFSIFIKFLL